MSQVVLLAGRPGPAAGAPGGFRRGAGPRPLGAARRQPVARTVGLRGLVGCRFLGLRPLGGGAWGRLGFLGGRITPPPPASGGSGPGGKPPFWSASRATRRGSA